MPLTFPLALLCSLRGQDHVGPVPVTNVSVLLVVEVNRAVTEGASAAEHLSPSANHIAVEPAQPTKLRLGGDYAFALGLDRAERTAHRGIGDQQPDATMHDSVKVVGLRRGGQRDLAPAVTGIGEAVAEFLEERDGLHVAKRWIPLQDV